MKEEKRKYGYHYQINDDIFFWVFFADTYEEAKRIKKENYQMNKNAIQEKYKHKGHMVRLS